MYKPTTFSLLKKQLDRFNFSGIVGTYLSDKHCKGFTTYRQLLTLIFAQLSGANSLKEIEIMFNAHKKQHYHLGLKPVKKSTLSYANGHRKHDVFGALLRVMIGGLNRKQKRELGDLTFLLDSTSIMLKGYGYDEWTLAQRNRCTQGLKVHVLCDQGGQALKAVNITSANVNDISVAQKIKLERGARYIFDKGYCDYDWWHKIDANGSCFITRLKANAAIKIIHQNEIPKEQKNYLKSDEVFQLSNKSPRAGKKLKYLKPLRRIIVNRGEKKESLVLVTNDLASTASAIADGYKERWLIELLFKWLKQNLKLKKFIGYSENAVKIQIYAALITYTLIACMKKNFLPGIPLKQVFLIVRTRLFFPLDFEQPPPKKSKSDQSNLMRAKNQ